MEDSDLEDSAQEMDIGPIARAQVGRTSSRPQGRAQRGRAQRAPSWKTACRKSAGACLDLLMPNQHRSWEMLAVVNLQTLYLPTCTFLSLVSAQVRRALKSIAMKQQKLQLTAEAQAQRSSHSFS